MASLAPTGLSDPLNPLGYAAAAIPTLQINGFTLEANRSTVAPAFESLAGEQLLTDNVLANLTALSLTHAPLFTFAQGTKHETLDKCKVAPGDSGYPDESMWDVFDMLTGGALIKTVPLASVCYDSWGTYNADACDHITKQWANVSVHYPDPSDLMYPLWQGLTCLPTADPTAECSLGGFPSRIVNATNVAQVQLAVNFARNLNLRLVIKNTGHDFNGRSAGAGALSIWTHLLKDIEFLDDYQSPAYSGRALKIGAGVQLQQMYEAADAYGVTVVGGLCTTVGAGGGYLAGGGHSPMSSKYGIAADSVLSVDIVTPDGRFVTANHEQNEELFWALRGGGGSTFGVVTSWTLKAYPKLASASVMSFTLASGPDLPSETLWKAVAAYWENVPLYNEAGNYGYWIIVPTAGDDFMFLMSSWLAPNMTTAEHQALVEPLFERWSQLGVTAEPTWQEFDSYLPAWKAMTDAEIVGTTNSKIANRLLPKENLEDPDKLLATTNALRDLVSRGVILVGYSLTGNPGSYPDDAVNPAWRENALYVIQAITWDAKLPWAEIGEFSTRFTDEWLKPLRDISPGAGSYHSEGDVIEPNFQQSFYGTETYKRLYKLKQGIDPTGVFYAHNAVGSEEWYITNQTPGLPTQNGRLCRI